MTTLLALKAADGIVIAADGVANRPLWSPDGNRFTIHRPMDKAMVVGRDVLLAAAGSVPLIQAVHDAVEGATREEDAEVEMVSALAAREMDRYAREADARYQRLHRTSSAGRAHAARILVGGITRGRTPTLKTVTRDAESARVQEAPGAYVVISNSFPCTQTLTDLAHRYHSADHSADAALALATGLLAALPVPYFRGPVRAWTCTHSHPAGEARVAGRGQSPLALALTRAFAPTLPVEVSP